MDNDCARPMAQLDTSVYAVEAQVKWFDARRGLGFLISDAYPADILLHANTLRGYGWSTIGEGVKLTVHVEDAGHGFKVRKIVSIASNPPPRFRVGNDSVPLDPETLEGLPILPGRVKWFDAAKGYGFVNVFGQTEDVFLNYEVLQAAGLGDSWAGEAIALRMMPGSRGPVVVQVVSWSTVAPAKAALPKETGGPIQVVLERCADAFEQPKADMDLMSYPNDGATRLQDLMPA